MNYLKLDMESSRPPKLDMESSRPPKRDMVSSRPPKNLNKPVSFLAE